MPVVAVTLTGVNLMLGSAVMLIVPLHGPVAASGAPPPVFTCDDPSSNQPAEIATMQKPAVIRISEWERRLDAFEKTEAPTRIATVMTDPITSGTCSPCAARNTREMFSTKMTIASATMIGVINGSRYRSTFGRCQNETGSGAAG